MPETTQHPLAYIDDAAEAERFASEIADVREVAMDTEGASFHRFVDRVYLLQVSTRERSAIIDPLPIATPAGLGRLVESREVEIVFHDADYDLRLLHQDYGWTARNVFDTRIAAQLVGLKAFGLSALLERYFGVKLDKQHQRADWSQRPLSRGMLDYAAQDTRWLLDLRDVLHDELAKRERLSWAREEFERLETLRWEAEEPGTAFMRMKGARDLNRRELAVLGQVVEWRDSVARQLDRSTFRVIGNEALFAIAREQPRTKAALAAIKGMPRGVLEQRGADVLAAVERGMAVPDAELPRFPRAPRWDRDADYDDRVSRLRAVRDRAAERLELDPGVLASRDRLETIARKQPGTIDELRELAILRNWQTEVLGEELLKALPVSGGGAATRPAAASGEKAPAVAEESPYRD